MKKVLCVICCLSIILAFAACGGQKNVGDPTEPAGAGGTESEPTQSGDLCLRVVDGAGTDSLVLAGEKSGEIYTVGASELTVTIDGEASDASKLKNGMLLYFSPGYEILETWPAQITGATAAATEGAGKDDHGNLSELYLQVLEDLWEEDSGINDDIEYISVYLDEAPGNLSEGEKAAITWIFSGRHNAQGLQLNFEELAENGYVDKDYLYWEDGLLFDIKSTKNSDSADTIFFSAQKWRSGTGAYFFTDCTAKRGSGAEWTDYEPGGFAIA